MNDPVCVYVKRICHDGKITVGTVICSGHHSSTGVFA